MKILYFFLYLWVIFALLDSDPDPATLSSCVPSSQEKLLLLTLAKCFCPPYYILFLVDTCTVTVDNVVYGTGTDLIFFYG
jgi:hypothetical protein